MSQSLIPDIKPLAGQEAVVDLHADDSRISEDETERNGDDGTHDKGLKICRTVTQVRFIGTSQNQAAKSIRLLIVNKTFYWNTATLPHYSSLATIMLQ